MGLFSSSVWTVTLAANCGCSYGSNCNQGLGVSLQLGGSNRPVPGLLLQTRTMGPL